MIDSRRALATVSLFVATPLALTLHVAQRVERSKETLY